MKVIGNKMKILRLEKGLTQVELCRRTGIRPSTMSLIETGVISPGKHAQKIARALGVKVEEIFR